MNGSEEYQLGEKFGMLEQKVSSVDNKIDNLSFQMTTLTNNLGTQMTNFTNGVGSRVESQGKIQEGLKVKTDNNDEHIKWVSKKVDRWVMTFIIGMAGIVAWIGKVLYISK